VTIVTGTNGAAGWATSRSATGTSEIFGDSAGSARLYRDLAERLRGERLRHYLHRLSDHQLVDVPEGPLR
jgi:uncharacterized protein YjiS (DUF1127 family)